MILTGERMILDRMKKETEIEHICRYKFAQQFVVGKRVLDAACGSGYGTKILAECAADVTGMDISAEAIAFAEKEYAQPNARYLVGSVDCLPFEDNSFDVIISFETIEHVNEVIQNSFLSEIKRVLKENGILIMSTPNKKKYTDERSGKHSEYHVKEFYVEEFRDFLGDKFDYVKFERQFYARSACIIDDESYQAQIEGFNEEGMYVVAIASDMNIKEMMNNSFVMRYPAKYERMNDYVQVFYSDTMSYSEENSQLVEIDNREEYHDVHIKLDGIRCRYLRIDPIKGRGMIRVTGIEIKLINGEKIQIDEYTSNASRKENGILYFCYNDPQIFIEFSEEYRIDLISFKFMIVNSKSYEDGEDPIVHLLYEENSNLKKVNDRLQKQITDIYDSKTWKIQQKIVKILEIFERKK